jgi:hypothetical protein
MQVFTIFFLLGSLALASAKLKVGVYYETLCGDSKRFIRSQLYPLMKNGGEEYLSVEFIPYGKASTTVSGSSFTFSCQHGKDECNGNKMHACAIKYLNKDTTLEFIRCSMAAAYPPTSLDDCAEELGIPENTYKQIKECHKSAEGKSLLANYGEMTNDLNPKLFFVPTITYNGVFDQDKMWTSQGNFKKVVCDELGQKPAFCASEVRTYRDVNNRGGRSPRKVQMFEPSPY